MNTNKVKQSLDDHLSKIAQDWVGTVLFIGAFLFILLGIMDFFVTPDNFKKFFTYRVGIAALLGILYYLNTLKRSKFYQYMIIFGASAFSAVSIEIMVLEFGGHRSAYYAGFNLVAICAIGFIPISLIQSAIILVTIYSIYLVPLIIVGDITDPVFIGNNAFMVATFIIALALRNQNQKLIIAEFLLREELAEEKSKLQVYSTKLEDLVAEKTKELTISEQRYRALFDNANDGIAVLDAKGTMVNVNRRFCELHGFEWNALLGEHYRLLEVESRPGEIEDRLGRILDGEARVYEAEHFTRGGGRIFLEVSAKAIDLGGVRHIQTFHRDITEKKRMQEELLQSQKMESIGVLAGGIAHDFNNILTAILGHAEILRRLSGPADEAAQRRIKTIEDAARRAGQMVSKLLSFARKDSLEMVPTDLNDVVQDTLELLERTLVNRDVKAVMELDRSLPAMQGDAIQLEQVITNLIVNAADAMGSGGTVTVRTSLAAIGREAAQHHPLLTEGDYAVLAVSDSGEGIPPGIMDRIFEPFFTTKGPGKGTGLGLAMVYGIVKAHKGEIRVRSDVGKGTTFEIYLPVSDLPVAEEEQISYGAMAGKENILVVDDEKDVLSYAKEILEAQGYKVVATDNPIYAQDLFRQIAPGIDAVLTDMVMPLVSGRELVRQFRKVKPDVKIIAMSGLDAPAPAGERKEFQAFLKKPFEGVHLLSVVRRVLDAAQPRSLAEEADAPQSPQS